MNKITFILFCYLSIQCNSQIKKETLDEKKIRQNAIILQHVDNCAEKYNYNTQMSEWQKCLDEGLKKDSIVAYLWQQKSMPYFKARKYEVGMKFLDKAVFYDARRWQPYRAFIKCIFSKTYNDAIADFQDCIAKYGNTYEMDHTYAFYIALSYLQLNEFKKAASTFKVDIEEQEKRNVAHYLDLFYYGICKYEQGLWDEAIVEFDKSLKQYPEFSEVKYYKAICLAQKGLKEESKVFFEEARADAKKGYTINEDNAVYESYPYKVRW